MLKTIKIKNVALIEEAIVNFNKNLNIISGETGAGKSVLLDCINLLIGAKADKTLIKSGADFLKVEGVFEIRPTQSILDVFKSLDLEFDECLIISRKITIDGKNEVKLNGETVPLSYIKTITKNLIDIHSQNENLTLLNNKNQLNLLDSFIDFDFNILKNLYNQVQTLNEKISYFNKDEQVRNRELELIEYQIKEIEEAKIVEGEEEALKAELLLLKNAEKITSSINLVKESYTDGYVNFSSLIKKILFEVNNLAKFKEETKLLEERINNAYIDMDDAIHELLDSFNNSYDPDRFNEIDLRLDLYKSLHKKYGISYEDIINFLNNIKEQKDKLLNFEKELEDLNKQKSSLLQQAFKICKDLTSKRQTVAKNLETSILEELKELSMLNAKIKFNFNNYNDINFENVFSQSGADSVEILFSANLGEDIKPLSQVASGGEIARLMLAIKTLTSNHDEIDTMIFDELDAGISGNASVQTSKKLAKISRNHQIIAVSHLFQICAMADQNILVKKTEENGKTYSRILEINGNDAVNELCRFLSVDEITDATIEHAKEVKEYLNNYKSTL